MTTFKGQMRRDDLLLNRLVFIMAQKAGLHVYNAMKIKANIYVIDTKIGKKVIKGYANFSELEARYRTITSLIRTGFRQAVNYECYPNGSWTVFCDGLHWAMTSYIPSFAPFSYRTFWQREQAITLLQTFHQAGEKVHPYMSRSLPAICLAEKWQKRLQTFQDNEKKLSLYLSRKAQSTLITWAEMSLERSKCFSVSPRSSLCILHGDVASHNFIQSYDKKLWLIDFDLLSAGPKEYEYVQLMHRFLRYTNWSFSALNKHPFLKEIITKELAFFLLFPVDLFREWNNVCLRQEALTSFGQMGRLIHKTKEELYYRHYLVSVIMDTFAE